MLLYMLAILLYGSNKIILQFVKKIYEAEFHINFGLDE